MATQILRFDYKPQKNSPVSYVLEPTSILVSS